MITPRVSRARCVLLGSLILASLGTGATLLAQSTQGSDALADVRRTLDAARKEIAAYTSAGGAAGTADHPAVKWDAELWAYRERYPGSEAAVLASTEAVRLLVGAALWDRAHARVDALDANDPAWERLPAVVYQEGIARKDVPYSIERISRVVAQTTQAKIKAAGLVVVGRAHRRQGDLVAASRALETAKTAAPGTPYVEEAEGLLYEIKYLSPGLLPPPISAKARSGRAVDLARLRGKAVVLVFWGTT